MWNFRRPSYYSYPFFPYIVPSPLYSEPLYTEPLYSTQTDVQQYPVPQYNYDGVIDDLRSQVQQLTYQVQQLQAELQAARALEPPPPPEGPPITVVLKDGNQIETRGYALMGSKLWILLSPQRATQIPISDVNIEATRRENLKKGIDVVIQSARKS
jgi:hypothetical protein